MLESLHTTIKKLFSKKLALIFIVSISIYALYLFFLASPEYTSTATLVLRAPGTAHHSDGSKLSGLIDQYTKKNSLATSNILSFITSDMLLNTLTYDADIVSSYQNKNINYLSRLKQTSDNEEIVKYLRDKIKYSFDNSSDVLTIKATAFTASSAQTLLRAVVDQLQQHAKQISGTLSNINLKGVTSSYHMAQKTYAQKQENLYNLEQSEHSYAPQQIVAANNVELMNLRSQLLQSQDELSSAQNTRQHLLRKKIKLLQNKIHARENFLLGVTKAGQNFHEYLDAYDASLSQINVAKLNYQWAANQLMQSQHRIFDNVISTAILQQPSLPLTTSYPKPLSQLLQLLFILLLGVILFMCFFFVPWTHLCGRC